jgi:succinate dehydrogenase/fumarate reductase flavoprotein subunit
VILATGGPGGIYKNSVYPSGQIGCTGLAFQAGVKGQNLTEWQYGLASINPKWNVSGSYMQVLPRFLSTRMDGTDEREFLKDYFSDPYTIVTKTFMKGYQWPFDVRKIKEGSSIIDILVFLEIQQGRRVYLDYTTNPYCADEFQFSELPEEVYAYCQNAEICFGTPIQRLKQLNLPAYNLFLDKGVDLKTDYLEIALCAQHNNGGIAVDCWWQTNVAGLFAVGEASGTHGVYRPGGSALNAGQVGSFRAAEYISHFRKEDIKENEQATILVQRQLEDFLNSCHLLQKKSKGNIQQYYDEITADMSKIGSVVRNKQEISNHLKKLWKLQKSYFSKTTITENHDIATVFRLYNILLTQLVYLSSFEDYIQKRPLSRGSALYFSEDGDKPFSFLPDEFRYTLDDCSQNTIQEIELNTNTCKSIWREPRPIPNEECFFEKVWKQYRENQSVY